MVSSISHHWRADAYLCEAFACDDGFSATCDGSSYWRDAGDGGLSIVSKESGRIGFVRSIESNSYFVPHLGVGGDAVQDWRVADNGARVDDCSVHVESFVEDAFSLAKVKFDEVFAPNCDLGKTFFWSTRW